MQYCAACLVAKDENYYLKEWAEYHLRIGFDTLIIYDNGSNVPIKETLSDLIAIGRVIVHEVPGEFAQSKFYTSCITTYRHDFKWIAFIDSDEFVFPKKTTNIKIFLAEYENYGGVVANWVIFGTSGLIKRKNNSQIFNFILTENAKTTTVKSIIQPAKTKIQGIHGATFMNGHYAVSSDHVPLHNNCYSAPFCNEKIQINHYFYRSWEDYEQKAARWISMNIIHKQISKEEEKGKYIKPSLELLKFYSQLKNIKIKPYSDTYNITSVKDFTTILLSILSNNPSKNQIMDAEILCCQAALAFDAEPMIWYFRAVISRITNDLQRALHCIYEALKLSGASTIYYEYARILSDMGDSERSRLATQQADYKKYVEDTTCPSVI